jgi:hypothetical protein
MHIGWCAAMIYRCTRVRIPRYTPTYDIWSLLVLLHVVGHSYTFASESCSAQAEFGSFVLPLA